MNSSKHYVGKEKKHENEFCVVCARIYSDHVVVLLRRKWIYIFHFSLHGHIDLQFRHCKIQFAQSIYNKTSLIDNKE